MCVGVGDEATNLVILIWQSCIMFQVHHVITHILTHTHTMNRVYHLGYFGDRPRWASLTSPLRWTQSNWVMKEARRWHWGSSRLDQNSFTRLTFSYLKDSNKLSYLNHMQDCNYYYLRGVTLFFAHAFHPKFNVRCLQVYLSVKIICCVKSGTELYFVLLFKLCMPAN